MIECGEGLRDELHTLVLYVILVPAALVNDSG
jgi:hypothetical protein